MFGDPDALDGPDIQHSVREARFLRLGRSVLGHVVIVELLPNLGGISARLSTRFARKSHRDL